MMRSGIAKHVLIVIAFLLLAGLVVEPATARPSMQEGGDPIGEGETIFTQKCAGCHSIGGGDRAGPDLIGVTALREHDWLVRIIVEPNRLIAEGDPIALSLLEQYNIPMPNLGVSAAQAEAIIAYLAAQSGEATAPAPQDASPPAAVAGDPAAGHNLFAGATRFENGGAACIACHDIAGVGMFGGGTLGPDLTQTVARFGEDGTASLLGTLSFPTMLPIYGERPLTPDEQAHLLALFQQAASAEPPASPLGTLALLAIAGAALLFVLAHLIWRGRLTAVRKPLLER